MNRLSSATRELSFSSHCSTLLRLRSVGRFIADKRCAWFKISPGELINRRQLPYIRHSYHTLAASFRSPGAEADETYECVRTPRGHGNAFHPGIGTPSRGSRQSRSRSPGRPLHPRCLSRVGAPPGTRVHPASTEAGANGELQIGDRRKRRDLCRYPGSTRSGGNHAGSPRLIHEFE